MSNAVIDESEPRYYVQSETVRGEPRTHWVVDKQTGEAVTEPSTRRRRTEIKCEKLNKAAST